MPKPQLKEVTGEDEDPQSYKTSKISEKKDGGREIYIYLKEGDELAFHNDETRLEVAVDEKGRRRWTVTLGDRDVLETGRLDPPPPPLGTGGGH